ncbi:related to RNA annealing protein [Cephalotrichum gorgonifer]|uniref:Related to RNA annealing protein n=1 Tax=Cephalotrichum gorgonifer TaxID=2041049 RepID=A0AAE8SRY1_9PEZI|nr:related to RNA annealing protein [Cephalotrichum gorgonifer]
MSGKLDKSLDEILSSTRQRGGQRRSQRRATGRPATTAPVGGVHKASKPARAGAAKATGARAAAPSGESKVIVSNLPKDVSEQQIKEYFVQSVGGIKKVELSYGPNSQSRGIANITFFKPDGASLAFQKLNGLLVDNRPIKIEIVVGAAQAASVIPQPKTLAERATQPKSQPRSAASDKHGAAAKKAGQAGTRGRGGKRRGANRSSRPAKKTAEELDSEMADYFDGGAGGNEGAAQAAAPATADAAMEEDISVRYDSHVSAWGGEID